MRWWGWGDPNHPPVLPAHALPFLRARIGVAEHPRPPVALGQVQLPPSRLSSDLVARLGEIAGADAVRDDRHDRLLHAAGKGYPDLVRMRAGAPEGAPDAVIYPADAAHVRGVLELAAEHRVAVVPFGGGTSVVGGVAPLRGDNAAVIAMDMGRLSGIGTLDRESLTVECGAGCRVARLEPWLAARGLTLGHFPQSYEYVTVGGCAATRSAGQASTGYGRFEDMVLGLRCSAPAGDLDLAAVPASAAGPSVRELLVGSEGTLGVITELTLRTRPAPRARIYAGAFFETFSAGIDALRTLAQQHRGPDVARLSDEAETAMWLALAGSGGLRSLLGRAYLRLRGYAGGCLAILGFEGDPDEVARRSAEAFAVVRRAGGLAVGRSPGTAWAASRYAGPYLRDDLLTLGVMVETLETATLWSGLGTLHHGVAEAISQALGRRGTPALVACHVSHIYESGASLYFTFLARQEPGAELAQWRAAKEAASRAIVEHRATITHHHAVGRDHLPWLTAEIGEQGVAALRAIKARLDPLQVMNPGKLADEGGSIPARGSASR